MTTILITGANGLVGQKLFLLARQDPNIRLIPTSRSEPLFDTGDFPFEYFDVSDFNRAKSLIETYRPDVVVHAAALSQVDYCEKNPGESEKINLHSVRNLAYLSKCIPFHLVFLSSDFVFSGDRGHYDETDIPQPLSVYGENKFNAEKCLMNTSTAYSIIRTSLVYGFLKSMSRPNIYTFVKDSLDQGKILQIVDDQYRSPTLAEDLAAGILAVIRQKRTGIYHLAGQNFLSVHDFALRIARHFGYNPSHVKPVKTEVLHEPARRPALTGLVIDKARKDLDFSPVDIDQGIRIVAGQM